MGTDGGGGVVDGVPLRRLQAILVPGWNPNFFFFFFANFYTNSFIGIHIIRHFYTNSFIQIHIIRHFYTNSYIRIHILRHFLYKLYSTNSHNTYIFLYKLYSTNSYNKPRARSAPRGWSPSREGEARDTVIMGASRRRWYQPQGRSPRHRDNGRFAPLLTPW